MILGREIIIRTDNLSVARALENQSGTQTPEEQYFYNKRVQSKSHVHTGSEERGG